MIYNPELQILGRDMVNNTKPRIKSKKEIAMKEFDYTKWDNKPREMWVWDKHSDNKQKVFVVYMENGRFLTKNRYLAWTLLRN